MARLHRTGLNGGVLPGQCRPETIRQGSVADLADAPAVELVASLIRAAVERSGLPAETAIDDVLMGQVLQAGSMASAGATAALLPVSR